MASVAQRAFDGSLNDPADRRYCHIFDAVAAIVATVGEIAPEVALGATAADAGVGALGADAVLGGVGETALLGGAGLAPGLTIPAELAGGIGAGIAPAVADIGVAIPGAAELAGDIGAGAGAAGAGVADVTGVGLGESGLGAALGSVPESLTAVTEPAAGLGTGVAPGVEGAATIGAAPGAVAPTVPTAATSVSGPLAAAPAAPASVPLSGPASGILTDLSDPAAYVAASPSQQVAADVAAASPASEQGSALVSSVGGGGGTGGSGASTFGSGLDKAISSATGGFLNKSDLSTILSAGGLGLNLLNRNKPIPGEAQVKSAASGLTATAAGQAAQGAQLEQFLQSGTLPPGLSAGVRSATESAKAAIRSGYAQRGESGSSAEAQDLQAAEERALTASQTVALQLLQQGSSMVGQAVNTEGLAAQLYQEIMRDALTRDQELGSAIGNFASSFVSPRTIQLKAA